MTDESGGSQMLQVQDNGDGTYLIKAQGDGLVVEATLSGPNAPKVAAALSSSTPSEAAQKIRAMRESRKGKR